MLFQVCAMSYFIRRSKHSILGSFQNFFMASVFCSLFSSIECGGGDGGGKEEEKVQ
jgi:hypothetical protein